MPLTWFLPPEMPAMLVSGQVQKPSLGDFGDELQVTGKVQEIDPVRQIVTYSDGVAAKFGPTMLFADRLEVHRGETERYAIARGNVRVEDPEGRFSANYVVFWYGPNKGPDGQLAVADHVQFELGGVAASAESAVIKVDQWVFLNVEATNCKRPIPFYLLRSKKIVVRPGKTGTVSTPKISLFGKPLLTLPTRQFSLDRRNPGLTIPTLAYRPDAGIGITWNSGFLLDDRNLLLASVKSFDGERPSYAATFVRSFIPAELATTRIEARSDLNERFSWSYFDNINVELPTQSLKFTQQPRDAVTLKSDWNTGSSTRLEREEFSKLLDVAYERSGPVGPLGVFGQVRMQTIRRGDEKFLTRGALHATIQAPAVSLSKGLWTDLRLDIQGNLSKENAFGWARSHVGVVFQPVPQFTAGAAWITSAEHGNPDFVLDQLYSRHAFHFRWDINLGPTKISYLAKYDLNRKNWYDKEYSISQVVGCFEPYILRREFPRNYTVGVRLRTADFLSILERRKQVRTKPLGPQTISRVPEKS